MKKRTRIRVAMVAPTFPLMPGTVNGGTQGASYYLCCALRESSEIDLTIIRPFAPPLAQGLSIIEQMKINAIKRPWWQPPPFHMLWLVQRQVRRIVDELCPDVVHVQGHAAIAAAQPQTKTILTVHGIIERDTLFAGNRYTRQLRAAYFAKTQSLARRRVHNIIAISPYTRQFLANDDGQRIWDIANPIADAFFATAHDPEPGRVFSASHLIPLKNVATLIRAFGQVVRRFPAAELRLAGSHQNSPYGLQCQRLASDLGIANRVKFLGLLSIQQVQTELARAACFVLCSLQENAPLSIAEAMAAGVPVLASNVGGIPWMVDSGITGRLVEPGSIAAVESGLCRMLLSDDLAEMSRRARLKALTSYRASIVAERTIAVYKKVFTPARV